MSYTTLNADDLISKVLDSVKTKLSEFNFNNWFKQSKWFVEENNQVKIQVPSKFVRDWIIENYLEVIKFEFFKLTGVEHQVYFNVVAPTTLNLFDETPTDKKNQKEIPVKKEIKKITALKPNNLNPRYSFDHFVVGNSNQFVNAACKAVANNPARNYNPLFIYGGVGLGKTHLLNAIGLEIFNNKPNTRVVFVTGEQFTNEVINAIRYDKTYEFRKKYRVECDVLLIDDVQFIAGKERTMEEFFHTFNALYEARKQIIMTSDTLPKDISNLEERLRSRFGWGLLADIQAPDFETRCAILQKKADDEGIKLPEEVCNFIASHIKSNVRDLEGCLIRVSAFASLAGVSITTSLANEVLRHILSDFSSQLSIESIQERVAQYFDLKISDLKSPKRNKHLALPRQIAMYLCKTHIKASFPEIGHKFGGKDHTTVIHAVQKIKKSMHLDVDMKNKIDRLEKIILKPAV